MASHARRKRSDDAKSMAQDRQQLIDNDPVYGKLMSGRLRRGRMATPMTKNDQKTPRRGRAHR
jgi:hypothetical protein